MRIKSYYMGEVAEVLYFNEETGKHEKKIGNFKIEVNSWNKKLFIKEKDEKAIRDVPEELIKMIININGSGYIDFEDEKVEDVKD